MISFKKEKINSRFLLYVVVVTWVKLRVVLVKGAAMLRTKGEPGTGNIAVRHIEKVNSEVSRLVVMNDDEIMTYAKELGAPYEVLKQIKDHGRLPVVNFAAGGVAHSRCCFNDGIRC